MTTPGSLPPTTPGARALAPDLGRGAMLALIALAHAQVLARGGGPLTNAVDAAAQTALTLFVDSRGYPMFAALFGFGMVHILRRQTAGGGWEQARSVLRRRGGWLVLFGFAHVLLLFPGDILAAYGLLAVCLVGALRWRDELLLTVACVAGAVGALVYGAVLTLPFPDSAGAPVDPLLSAAIRMATFPVLTPLNAVMAAGPVLVGVWAARRHLLDEPERHRRLLSRIAGVGIAVAVVGALPQVLVTTGQLQSTGGLLLAAGALHTATGYAGGLGYAALIGVVAARLGRTARQPRRDGRIVTALRACGQRSMSCYLAQSVFWLVLFEPYLADLGGELGVAGAVAVGLAVWVLTVVAADLLHRLGRPGPAEALLRRLTYGSAVHS
ncbi:DUF418 domain-containing protein [Pseudonocardia yunnanensis]|uniref:DUF418 domain-containing protein n=1 Tax=Pseudonocardia yunnanensis TaxID=58107 RepID=A0ABW4EY06_9PSEU